MKTYQEVIQSEEFNLFESKQEAINEGNSILSLASWHIAKKKVSDQNSSLEEKLSSIVDLIGMAALLNQKTTQNEISNLSKQLNVLEKKIGKMR